MIYAKEIKDLFDTPQKELSDAAQNILKNTANFAEYIKSMLDKYPALKLVIDIGLFLDIGNESAVKLLVCKHDKTRGDLNDD